MPLEKRPKAEKKAPKNVRYGPELSSAIEEIARLTEDDFSGTVRRLLIDAIGRHYPALWKRLTRPNVRRGR